MKLKIFTLIMLFPAFLLHAQPSLKELHRQMEESRKISYKPVPESILKDEKNEGKLIEALQTYTNDTLETMRGKAYHIAKLIGQKSIKPEVRQEAVDLLVQGLQDKSSGISGNAIEALTGFRKSDFTASHKNTIGNLLVVSTPHVGELAKLAGYLEMTDHAAKLEELIRSKGSSGTKWAARLALARLGDPEALDFIMIRLGRATISDDFVYDIVPDLVYTRQRDIFKYLESFIHSNEANCLSADPDSSQKILCCYRVMEYLATTITNFPLPIDESGTLVVKDYEQALKELRAWFLANPAYGIDREGF